MSERVCGCERDAKVAASYACERERGAALPVVCANMH